jgi:hypothetical protein
LFEHALRLHRRSPDGPLVRGGEPYPDASRHDRRSPQAAGQRSEGAAVAEFLDRHFGRADASPSELADAFHGVYVPLSRNRHIEAAALRADRERVRVTGRWLVRHSDDRCSTLVGLALLATDGVVEDDDIAMLRTIGLLSGRFARLAVECLVARARADAVLWLAQRVTTWGRVYAIEALCRGGAGLARDWLLRNSCNADILDGYYAGLVAREADLHAAIVVPDADDALIDHTGWLLFVMAECDGMGTTLQGYPSAAAVLTAHAGHRAGQLPTAERYGKTRLLVDQLSGRSPERCGCTRAQWERGIAMYRAVLDDPDWRPIAGKSGRRA